MPSYNLFKVSQNERNNFCEEIIDSSAPSADFYLLVILSTLIVAFGLIKDNVILVIGGMLVTPILSPILAISLGIIIRNFKVIQRSVVIFISAFVLACFVAFLTGVTINFNIKNLELIKIMEPSLYTFIVAIVAGIAASYTWAKPNLNNALPGIAITVTLIPPLTAIGLALASSNWPIFKDVLNVLLLNVLGIILASIIVFIFMEFYKSKRKIIAELKEEEKEMEK